LNEKKKKELSMVEIIPNWHPLLVHFPIALVSLSALFHLAARIFKNQPRYSRHCAVLAHTTLWIGALAALPTVILGWLASNSVNHDEVGHIAMSLHRAWALATFLVLFVLASWDARRNKVDATPSRGFVGAVIFAWGLVAITAWHGGELVYRHGLGVIALPAQEGSNAHVHHHDDAD
jgi:uncharacterized membrane protein